MQAGKTVEHYMGWCKMEASSHYPPRPEGGVSYESPLRTSWSCIEMICRLHQGGYISCIGVEERAKKGENRGIGQYLVLKTKEPTINNATVHTPNVA